MNSAEQRARQTRGDQLNRRMDNVEEIVEALAKQIVTNRAAHVEATQGTRACCDERWQAAIDRWQRNADAHDDLFRQFAHLNHRTLWQRLRVLVLGHP